MGTNDTINELRAYLDDRADADQPAGASAPIPNEEMRLLQGLDRLAQEHNAYAKMIDRLQSTLDRVLSRFQPLELECDVLRAENERLRAALEHYAADYDYELGVSQWDGGAKAREALYCDEATAIAQETGQYDEWIAHDSTEPPAGLAPAQLVDACTKYGTRCHRGRVDRIDWNPGLRYRPALSASGLPLCSAEGLDSRAQYVAFQPNTSRLFQFARRPTWWDTDWVGWLVSMYTAPSTHRRPGPASESLMEVHRD